jgi:hypothetical protein
MSESISIYPALTSQIVWDRFMAEWTKYLPKELGLHVHSVVPIFEEEENRQEINFPSSFRLSGLEDISFHIGIFRLDEKKKGYLMDEISEVVKEEGAGEIFRYSNEESVNKITKHSQYYINIVSSARRSKNENMYILAFAKAFVSLTKGFMFVTEPKFFGIKFGIYDVDGISKIE